MRKSGFSNKSKRFILKCYRAGIMLFFGLMILGCVLGFIIPIRPTESQVENRKLTEFPKFTMSSFLDGSYFSEISTWYSDTYPMRESLIAMDQKIEKIYGFETSSKMVGSAKTADAIPVVEDKKKDDKKSDGKNEDDEDVTDDVVAESIDEDLVGATAPNSKVMEEEIQNQIQGNLYVDGDKAYSVYYFSQKAAEHYAEVLNRTAKRLEGQCEVYSILVPNNTVVLDDATLDKLGGSDQYETIKYYRSLYDGVHSFDTFTPLREHKDEYIYYRTDHHWTQRGAYYAYRGLCEKKGIKPHELSEYETKSFSPFLGSSYSALKSDKMKANPDTIEAFVPIDTNNMVMTDNKGESIDWYVIADVTGWDAGTLYSCFIGGDEYYVQIDNPKISDGTSCLVIKESYGNSLVPFLVDHYDKVYVLDFRYTDRDLISFIKDNGITDLIVINNLNIIASDSVVDRIDALFNGGVIGSDN